MDVRQLRYFLQITESGSFSRAAEVLHVAQPSLSQHVRSLEEELGGELLTRHARGVIPTDLGLTLCHHARTILREVERAKEAVRSSLESPAGEITLGLPTSACRGLAIPLIKAVASRYPRITIHLVEAMTGSLDEWMQTGRLDVALLYEHRVFENIAVKEVLVEELMLVGPSGFARTTPIAFAELNALQTVLPSRPHVLRVVIEQAAARAGISLNVRMNCDSLMGILQLVRNGYTTVFPPFAFAEEIARGEMVTLPIVDPTPAWRLSVVVSKRTSNLRASEAIAGLVHEVSRDLVRKGVWRAQLKPVDGIGGAQDCIQVAHAPFAHHVKVPE